ncbi:multidrug ABC transporter ATP-binding protein [Meridianimarinicoccus roseus]|uniref:Multidrug ABC transporter ATP-binding protein n=1 Tax=Meridianimarinicoccus roseus TaxID=2072018 RepID=A0A2V2LLJ5_9RHOB|nr:ABC transporter ATP-binding protein [Meridianimarinicoccus roseus]PWR03179.1 multidrug ABC transporter ATP-binding protein [Meridianimarinicoccus roseus]
MAAIIQIDALSKTYGSGFQALRDVDLSIEEGEILALLGPNGAGKTTLISSICGITRPTSGQIRVGGYDVLADYRAARRLIGLVPQEIVLEPFTKVRDTIAFSRGIFGLPPDPARVEQVLRRLSLWDKKDAMARELSGGMRRRVMIAKALAHDPRVLFLDEPTAGVDVELRRDMWDIVRALKADGVTIILTTHYIEEAEAIADRVGVINGGRILLMEEKARLMRRLGKKTLRMELRAPLPDLPAALTGKGLDLEPGGQALLHSYDANDGVDIAPLLADVTAAGLGLRDVQTRESSLEDIFVDLLKDTA